MLFAYGWNGHWAEYALRRHEERGRSRQAGGVALADGGRPQ